MKVKAGTRSLWWVFSAFMLPALAATKTGKPSSRNLRSLIVNGKPVAEPYPFYGFFEVGCGTTIVAPDMLLTAAHCDYWDVLQRRVWFGSTELRNGTLRTVVDRFPHPQYLPDSTGEYDFMLMKVNASLFVENDGQTPTNLEAITINSDELVPVTSQELLAIGHGRNRYNSDHLEEHLQEVSLFAYDDDVCIAIHNQTAASDPSELAVVPESMFCAGQGPLGFGGTCNGDSGGPIIDPSTGNLVGTVNWAYSCSRYGYPSVFGRVSSAYDWMNQMICENSCFPDPDLCAGTTNFHPCATMGTDGLLSSGNIGLNLTIKPDLFPGEIAFLLEHVEYGIEVQFQPYETYSYADLADLGYGEDLIIQHSFENLPSGTYRLVLGDSGNDGICYGYSNCLDQQNVILSFLDSGESIWTDNGRYFSGKEVYVEFDDDGNVLWVSEYNQRHASPTPAPTEAPGLNSVYSGGFPDP